MFKTAYPRVQMDFVRCQFCKATAAVVKDAPLKAQLARHGWKVLNGLPVCSADECDKHVAVASARELSIRMGERDNDD